MAVEQRDVFLLPPSFNSDLEDHPFIVLSNKETNQYENTFIAVMITSSSKYRDELSFPINSNMFEKQLKKEHSHVRMHLMTLCLNEEIQSDRINRMKPLYFNQLMNSIGEIVFGYRFTPLEEKNI